MKAHSFYLSTLAWLTMSAAVVGQYVGYPYYGPVAQSPTDGSGPMPGAAPPTVQVPAPPGVPIAPSYSAPSTTPPSYTPGPYSPSPYASTPYTTPAPPANPWATAPAAAPQFSHPASSSSPFAQSVFSGSGSSCTTCGQGAPDCGGCDSCGCDSCGCDFGRGPRWFGGLAGLILTRDNGNRQILTTPTTNFEQSLLSTRNPAYNWQGGFEAKIGYVLGCSSAIEASYFMVDPFERSALVTSDTNSLTTTLNFDGLTVGGGPVQGFYTNSAEQQFQRRDELHNVEVNWLENLPFETAGRIGLTAIAGARWFRFDEGTSYGAAAASTTFGANGGLTSAFFDESLHNNFIGGQLGARGQYFFTPNLRVYATPKVGVGAMTIDKHVIVKRGDGVTALDQQSYKNDVAMLSQLDVGASYQVTARFSAYIGYRAVAVTGLALYENNIPRNFGFTGEVREIQSNGSLILHGAIAGGQFAY